ncbi:MAG: diacylglycerol kinase family lipid kinase [Candidatus Pacebacteria bacterium]|jgi:diacylglycerol kinase (ATP)|nr:diacylglycerol kinase family lipid kinase [Candidatus Paceibacterota bacterium]
MKIAAIVNPISGDGRGARCGKMIKESNRGIDVFETTLLQTAADLTWMALAKGYQMVIAAGGDGTVSEVAGVLAGSKIPLAVIPSGTGNDFSKGLGIPQNPREALETALCGKKIKIDAGTINGRVFINAASFGLDAKLTGRIPALKRSRFPFPGKLLYLIAFFQEMSQPIGYPEVEVHFQEKGEIVSRRTTILVAANGPQYGAMFKIAPEASFTDGFLDICWIGKMRKKRILTNIHKVLMGTHLDLPETGLFRARSFTIRCDNELNCQVDGEVLESRKEYSIGCLPRALEVVIPGDQKWQTAEIKAKLKLQPA